MATRMPAGPSGGSFSGSRRQKASLSQPSLECPTSRKVQVCCCCLLMCSEVTHLDMTPTFALPCAGKLAATQQQAQNSKMLETLRNRVGIPLALTHVSTNLWAGTNPGYVFPMIHQRSASTADFACWGDAEVRCSTCFPAVAGDLHCRPN